MDMIHKYLIESLRHDNGHYHNKIEANQSLSMWYMPKKCRKQSKSSLL